jgi:hypothetical protein
LGYLEDAISLLRTCAWIIIVAALCIIAAAGWGLWLDHQGRLNPLLASIHLTPNWAEMLFVGGVVAFLFLVFGVIMLWASGDFREDTASYRRRNPDDFANEGPGGHY